MTTKDAAEVLNCTRQHVCKLIKTGKLRAKLIKNKLGEYYEIKEEDVKAYKEIPQTVGWTRGRSRKTIEE